MKNEWAGKEPRKELFDILTATGEDTSGWTWRHLEPGEALRAVKELREDYEDACQASE